MSRKIDLTGQRYGRLIVIKEAGRDHHGSILWECVCDCGNIKNIRSHSLRCGNTKSCGCLQKEKAMERLTTHGLCKTPTYKTWAGMIKRTTNPKYFEYSYYGGRGIRACRRWLKFENFYTDMGERPKGLTIERENNGLGYFKENCYWASPTEQSRNRRIRNANKTGATGVWWNKRAQKYQASIGINYKQTHLGYFTDLDQATQARKQAELNYW